MPNINSSMLQNIVEYVQNDLQENWIQFIIFIKITKKYYMEK